MLEVLAGSGLASAAGLNAYIPLVVLGALGRWTSFVELPESWQWLTNGWVLAILVLLLVVDVVQPQQCPPRNKQQIDDVHLQGGEPHR